MSAADSIAFARSMVGTRWRHLGRKPWAVDCVGLVVLSLQSSGWPEIKDRSDYGREPWDDMLRKTLQAEFGSPAADRQPGDIALIRWGRNEPSHVGILAGHPFGGLSIIHAHNIHGVIETALSGEVEESVIEVYRPDWSTL